MKLRSVLAFGTLAFLTACNLARPGIPLDTALPATSPAEQRVLPAATNQPAPGATTAPGETAAPAETPTALPTADAGDLMVIYTKDGQLWRWKAGHAAALSASEQTSFPTLSPDGQMVVFLRQADAFHQELWAVNADGSNERRLVAAADLDRIGGGVGNPNAVAVIPASNYEWLPGATQLFFTTTQIFNGPGVQPLNDLHRVDALTGQIIGLFLTEWGGRFVIAPNGSRLALIQPEKVLISGPNGEDYRQVMDYPAVLTYGDEQFYASPYWSPDDSFLRVAIPPVDALAAADQITGLWRIPIDGSPPIQEGGVAAVFFVDTPVTYSPDVSWIAYIHETGTGEAVQRELHLAGFDGSADRVYAADPFLQFLGWSPNSRRFLYSLGDESRLYLGGLDAEPQTLTPELDGVFRIQWVDGRQFLSIRQRPGGFELLLFDVESGGILVLEPNASRPPAYDWTR